MRQRLIFVEVLSQLQAFPRSAATTAVARQSNFSARQAARRVNGILCFSIPLSCRERLYIVGDEMFKSSEAATLGAWGTFSSLRINFRPDTG